MLVYPERALLSRSIHASSHTPVPSEAERDGQSKERILAQRPHAAAGT